MTAPHAEHRADLAGLPWGVEPTAGWKRGERFSHRGDVPDSPGWSVEQKETVDRMWAELRKLSIAVVDHPTGRPFRVEAWWTPGCSSRSRPARWNPMR
ncbi:hypothetical protein OG523_00865 [Streptomyces virginiae]|uniref:hypothetical protein n=1 Tax=Streptomyces virginiae TaxID=1961 RepID=UPI002E32C81C|nr:hypothetical protein [Streptomyces virginiae]